MPGGEWMWKLAAFLTRKKTRKHDKVEGKEVDVRVLNSGPANRYLNFLGGNQVVYKKAVYLHL